EAGADIALALSQALSDDPVLPSARVSVGGGRVLFRLVDIYGRTENLAARLTSFADRRTVRLDILTDNVLAADDRYILVSQPPQSVRGFGPINPSMLLRGAGDGIEVD